MDEPNNLQNAEKLDANNTDIETSSLNPGNNNTLPPFDEDNLQKKGVVEKKIDGVTKVTNDGIKEIHGPDFGEVDFDDELEDKKENKKRKRFSPKIGCSCRSCSCFGCFSLILILLLIIATIYFRPPLVLNLAKKFLNNGYNPPSVETVSNVSAVDMIKQDLEDNQASISESQLTALAKDTLNTNNLYVDIEPNYLRLVTNLSDEDNPLWFIIELGQGTDSNLNITKVGFNRVSVPGVLRNVVSNGVFSAINLSDIKGKDEAFLFTKFLMDAEDNEIQFDKVRFDKDKLVIEDL